MNLFGFGKPDIPKLKSIGDTNGLIKALTHKDAKIRASAAEALGSLKSMEALDALVEATTDVEDEVQAAAAEALGKLSGPAALETLRRLLLVFMSPESVRRSAARALGEMGDEGAVPVLIEGYWKAKARGSLDVGERREIIEALSNYQTREVVNLLAEAIKDQSSLIQYYALLALQKNTKDPKVQRVLIHALERSLNPEVRVCAAESLGLVGGTLAFKPLLAAKERADESVREAAKQALEKIRERTGVEPSEETARAAQVPTEPLAEEAQSPAQCPPETWTIDQCLKRFYVEQTETRNARSDPALGEVSRLGNEGQYQAAIAKAEEMLKAYPDLDYLYLWQGICFRGLGDLSRARTTLLESLKRARSKAYLCCEMGNLEREDRNAMQALGWWCQSIHCHESNPHDLDNSPYLYLAAIAGGYGLKREYDALQSRAYAIRSADLSYEAMNDLQKLFIEQKSAIIETVIKKISKHYFKT